MSGYTQQKQHNPIGDVELPAAIRRQTERATRLHEEAYKTEKPEGEGDAPEGEAPAQPDGGQDGGERQPAEANFHGSEGDPKEGTQAPAETPTTPAPDALSQLEHKYNTLNGRFKRMGDDLRASVARVSTLESENADLRRQLEAKTATPENRSESLISEQERTEYGADFLDVSARAAREKLDPELKELRETVKQLSTQLSSQKQSEKAQSTQSIFQKLDAEVPNWQEINRSAEFLNWLALRDEYSGDMRNNLLQNAFNSFDGERVVRFFKGFLSDEATVAPTERQPATTPAAPASGKVPLEAFAAPGRAKTAAASDAPAGKPTITKAQIVEFYNDVRRGAYRGREADQARLEQMIFDAQNDGRVLA